MLVWGAVAFQIASRPDARRVYARVTSYAMLALVTSGLVISLFSRELLTLVTSREYVQGWPLVAVLALGYVGFGFYNLFQTGLLVAKRTHWLSGATLVGGGVNIALNFLMIPAFGTVGAAWSKAAGFFCVALLTLAASQRVYRVPFEHRRLVALVAVAILTYVVATGVSVAGWSQLSVKLCALLAFPALLYATGFFSAEEGRRAAAFLSRARRRVVQL
jgi:O-antigen/teichoic acid export membrane protein